jgi:dienelactone hydrolase
MRVNLVRLAPLLPLFLALTLAPAAAAGPAPAPSDSGATAAPSAAAGRIADALFTALQNQDYATAFGMFDEKMKVAVPLEKLKTIWNQQLTMLGNFLSWEGRPGAPKQGFDLTLAGLKFEGGQLRAAVYSDPSSGKVTGFYLKPAGVPGAPAAAYVDTTRFQAIDVTVGSSPFVLGGTLTVPSGRGPFPGVVLVHGSGPQDRDETIGANKVFKDLAEGLASRGIEVLRYEKRTRQYAALMAGHATIEEEVMIDAVAAAQVLRARPEVDRDRVFVLGHSLGAMLAPEIAVRSGGIAGVVLLAPPGRPPWDIVLAQMRYLGSPEADVSEAERKVALLKQGKLGDEPFMNAPQSYWQDWGRRDGIAMARKLKRPILILRGDRDYQVAEEDVENWKKGLAGVPHVEVSALPGLNHLFILGSGKPGPAEYDVPGHVDPSVIEKIAAFVASNPAKGTLR